MKIGRIEKKRKKRKKRKKKERKKREKERFILYEHPNKSTNSELKLKAVIINYNISHNFQKGSRFIEKARQICNFERCWTSLFTKKSPYFGKIRVSMKRSGKYVISKDVVPGNSI